MTRLAARAAPAKSSSTAAAATVKSDGRRADMGFSFQVMGDARSGALWAVRDARWAVRDAGSEGAGAAPCSRAAPGGALATAGLRHGDVQARAECSRGGGPADREGR